MHAGDERRLRTPDRGDEVFLTLEQLGLRLDQLVGFVEVLQDVVVGLDLEAIEPIGHDCPQRGLRVREVAVHPVRLANHADDAVARLDLFLGHGVNVDERSARGEKRVDVTQGVHDALIQDSSQRPREEREVELSGRCLDLRGSGDHEPHVFGEICRQRCTRGGDPLLVRVDRKDGGRYVRELEGQPTVAASKLENAQPVHRRDLTKRTQLDALWIDSPGHREIVAELPAWCVEMRKNTDEGSGRLPTLLHAATVTLREIRKELVMKKTQTVAAFVALVAAASVLLAVTAVAAPGQASLLIRHQVRGCHAWSANGGAFKAGQSIALHRGGFMTVTNNDVMPHKLVKTSGPAVQIKNLQTGMTGKGMHRSSVPGGMSNMGASVKVVFSKAGVYQFATKAGEDYMSGVKTIGEDNVLRLKVTVR
jgi:hypothetical protein